MYKILVLILISIYVSGCGWALDLPRSVWGSSIRVLSDKRKDAQTQEFLCSVGACFDSVMAMTLPYGEVDEEDDKFVLFAKDPRQRYLIIMDVPDSVDTTEVGVFFDDIGNGKTKVDISSLSSRAKKKAAQIIFSELAAHCGSGE